MIGEMLGAYRILRRLGAGGMGEVYLAEHTRIARRAAIKVLLPEFSHNQSVVERFFTEARATSLIQHPGIVEILDCDVHPSGRAYIVMELLEGESLRDCLTRTRGLANDLPAVRAIGCQVADALAAAHEKGIVHRDIKPDNIFLAMAAQANAPWRVKLVDFGIAKLASDAHGGISHTRTGSMLGTPVYMSPEQCRGAGSVDHRADIYSLGCVLFEMLCSRPPFARDGIGELIAAHMTEVPTRVAALQPGVPPGMDGLIADMLAKDPELRPQSMHEVAVRLGYDAEEPKAGTLYLQPGPVPSAVATHGTGQVFPPRSYAGTPPSSPGFPAMPTGSLPGRTGATSSSNLSSLPGQRSAPGSPSSPGGIGPQATPPPYQGTRILLPDQHQTTLSNTAAEMRSSRRSIEPESEAIPETLPRRSRKSLIIAASIAGGMLIAGALVVFGGRPASQPGTSTRPETVAPLPNATPGVSTTAGDTTPALPRPAAPRRVIATLSTTPAGAEVFVSDESAARGKTPLDLELPSSEQPVAVVVKLDGYKPRTLSIPTQLSSKMDIRLEQEQQVPKTSPSTSGATSPAVTHQGHKKDKGKDKDKDPKKPLFAPIDD